MILTRRGFLKAILAAGAAPAIVRADSLMKIVPREVVVLTPDASPSWFSRVISVDVSEAPTARYFAKILWDPSCLPADPTSSMMREEDGRITVEREITREEARKLAGIQLAYRTVWSRSR